jgi:hypothetical protein
MSELTSPITRQSGNQSSAERYKRSPEDIEEGLSVAREALTNGDDAIADILLRGNSNEILSSFKKLSRPDALELLADLIDEVADEDGPVLYWP